MLYTSPVYWRARGWDAQWPEAARPTNLCWGVQNSQEERHGQQVSTNSFTLKWDFRTLRALTQSHRVPAPVHWVRFTLLQHDGYGTKIVKKFSLVLQRSCGNWPDVFCLLRASLSLPLIHLMTWKCSSNISLLIHYIHFHQITCKFELKLSSTYVWVLLMEPLLAALRFSAMFCLVGFRCLPLCIRSALREKLCRSLSHVCRTTLNICDHSGTCSHGICSHGACSSSNGVEWSFP